MEQFSEGLLIKTFLKLKFNSFQLRSLGSIRHPHLVAILGFCYEPKCLVLEYMHNGSLEEMLLSKTRSRALSWHDRIRIALEVCSGLAFLNTIQPRPIIHCHPSPSNILLDYNLVAKIKGFGLHNGCKCNEECNVESDMKAIVVLLLYLLTGKRNWVGMEIEALYDEIDEEWPLGVGRELMGLAMRCMSMNYGPNVEMNIARVMEELNEIRRKGDESNDVLSVFLCPILQVSLLIFLRN